MPTRAPEIAVSASYHAFTRTAVSTATTTAPPDLLASWIMSVMLDELSEELVAGMLIVHNDNRDSFWYRFYDYTEDMPELVPKIKDSASEKEKEIDHQVLTTLTKYDNLSLRKELGVNQLSYTELLLKERF